MTLRELIEAAAPSPWFWDSYDNILSKPLCVEFDADGDAFEHTDPRGDRLFVASLSRHAYYHDRKRLAADGRLIALAPQIADLLDRAETVVEGLMDVAEMAMPDTYFETDSRTTAARAWREEFALLSTSQPGDKEAS